MNLARTETGRKAMAEAYATAPMAWELVTVLGFYDLGNGAGPKPYATLRPRIGSLLVAEAEKVRERARARGGEATVQLRFDRPMFADVLLYAPLPEAPEFHCGSLFDDDQQPSGEDG